MENNKSIEEKIKEPSNALFKTGEGFFDEKINSRDIKMIYTKKVMNDICNTLTIRSTEYKPEKTMEYIKEFVCSDFKMKRLLYSEISSYIFKIYSDEKIGIFATNLEKLITYVTEDKSGQLTIEFDNGGDKIKIQEDCHKIAVKIYDHFHLSYQQLDKVNNVLLSGIKSTKTDVENGIKKELKSIEKDYITILGIFASIILAFVGGITFSSSVLNNIHQASIFRIIIVANFLAFSVLNILHLLVSFISEINEKKIQLFKIKHINKIFLWIGIITIIAWFINIHLYKLENKLYLL